MTAQRTAVALVGLLLVLAVNGLVRPERRAPVEPGPHRAPALAEPAPAPAAPPLAAQPPPEEVNSGAAAADEKMREAEAWDPTASEAPIPDGSVAPGAATTAGTAAAIPAAAEPSGEAAEAAAPRPPAPARRRRPAAEAPRPPESGSGAWRIRR